MNQNILIRLEKQAEKLVLDIPASLDCDEYTPLFNEKFAELIVRECIDTISDCSIEYCTRPQIVNEIKQHFGVEE